GTRNLIDAAKKTKNASDVVEYVAARSPLLLEKHPLMWTPKHPRHVIIPYYNYSKVVGYLGRNIDVRDGDGRFIQRAPDDYMFNQHLIPTLPSEYAFVVEAPLDAILIDGVAIRGSKLSQRQINLLRVCG